MEELYAIVSGRVQGVMMRDFVQRSAKKIGIVGYVKNLRDGTVEVLGQGSKEGLEVFLGRLHRGSLFARVDGVETQWRAPQSTYSGFIIDYSA
jgi:acylphosphatase